MTIEYVEGDATSPSAPGPKIIVHVCNDIGKWGKGFVLAISKRWKAPEQAYKAAFASNPGLALGDVQFIPVSDAIVVANLVGQHGVATRASKTPPVRYEAIENGLRKVRERARADGASVHMPRIGCGLAGGDWSKVESIVKATLVDAGIVVTVYDFVVA